MIEQLLETPIIRVLLTALISVIVIGIFVLINKFIERHQDALKKQVILVLYIIDLVLSLAAMATIALIWGVSIQTMTDSVNSFIRSVVGDNLGALTGSVIVIMIALFIMRVSVYTLKRIGEKESPSKGRRQTIAKVLQSIVKYTVTIISAIIILSMWGVDVAPALAGLGILGLVIGLGAQKLIADIINGFFIIFEQHFNVGERVEIQGFKGDVIDIGLKTTKVMSWKGEVKIFNNGDISSVTNFSRKFSMAIAPFSISYESNMQATIDLLTEALKDVKNKFPVVLEDPIVLGVTNLNDSGVDMSVICKTESEQHYAVERYLKQRIKEILDEHNIEIPFPQIVVSNKE
ncbi:MAG: mechanosensitive ion channel family protein [Acholeplasmataceae bacterium]|nr:mechanosensitive ion channel family protein [Acholeplasmataceae bacterium]